MKPNHILALCAFLDSVVQLYPWLTNHMKAFPLTGFIGLAITIGLLRKNRFSFRAYRFYLWIAFLFMLLLILISIFGGESYSYNPGKLLRYPFENFPPLLIFSLWLAAYGWVLYYTEKDKVREAYNLPPKKPASPVNPDTEEVTE